MQRLRHKAGLKSYRRAFAVLGCLALLYFAAGGTLLHQHAGGTDTVCPVCHSLHTPVLAAHAFELFPQEQQITWQAHLPEAGAPFASFALHRASRAPPVA
jgi:hypothetical protein